MTRQRWENDLTPALHLLGASFGVSDAGVVGRHANPSDGSLGHRGICALTLGVGVYGGNAAPGIRHKPQPWPSCDGNGRGLTGLNQSREFAEADSPCTSLNALGLLGS